MRKGDRASSKPSSSARAAEVLASKAGAAGFGFGGFSGSTLVSPNVVGFGFGAAAATDRFAVPSASADSSGGGDYGGSEAPLMMQVDGELAQCLRHLAKRDPVTKTKALQNLRALIPSRAVVDLRTAMPPWIYMYNRLVLDSSRAVRSEAANTLSCLLTAVGKAVAPHLKGLIGPWFLAMYDPYSDAAEASRSAFINAFPAARRQLDVLLFCRTEIMSYLKDQLAATPQQLGDAKKDSPEELEERHERVQTACLAALAALIVRMTDTLESTTGTAAESESAAPSASVASVSAGREEVLGAVRAIISRPGFWKATACSKCAAVRRAAYGFARCTALRACSMLVEECAAESALCILGAVGEKEPGNHGAMWEAVLTYGKACPDAWRHVNLRKMLLPRLYSLLRHGCYGSATVSLAALLPLLPLLPPGSLGPDPHVVVSVLDAVWDGMQSPAGASRAAKSAGLSAYRECLAWALINCKNLATTHKAQDGGSGAAAAGAAAAAAEGTAMVATAAAGGEGGEGPGPAAAGYCRALLEGSLAQHVLPAVLRGGPHGEAARGVVAGLAQQLAAVGGDAGVIPLTCLADRVGLAVRSVLENRVREALGATAGDSGGGDPDGEVNDLSAACEGTASLLAEIRGGAAACSWLVGQLAGAAAQGLMWAGPSSLPPAASLLLATLLREYGTAASVTGSVLAVALPPPPPLLPPLPDSGLTVSTAERGAGAGAGVMPPVTGAGVTSVSSFDLHSLVAALKAGPAAGPAAEATADLLVAFCSAHHGNTQAVWEQVMEALLPQNPPVLDVNATSALNVHCEGLQRTALLLQRCAGAWDMGRSADSGGRGDGSQGDKGSCQTQVRTQQPFPWTCAALDAVAVEVAQRAGSEACAEEQQQEQSLRRAAAVMLSRALGGNAARLVMLMPSAAGNVLRTLTAHLTAAVELGPSGGGGGGTAAAAQAAVFALDALRDPLGGADGLWRLLPDEACAALAAIAQLGWQAPYSLHIDHTAELPHRGSVHGSVDEGPDTGSAGAEEEEEEEVSEAGTTASESSFSAAGRPREEEEQEQEEEEEGATEGLVTARRAASALWRDPRPLAMAAEVLPPARLHELIQHLSKLLALCACTAGAPPPPPALLPRASVPSLSPRAWAAHAAQLLGSVPGSAARHQEVLDVLLSARTEWRSWSALAEAREEAAGGPPDGRQAVASAEGVAGPAGSPGLTAPCLEYLARLAEAGKTRTAPRRGAVGTGLPASSRCWVLLELLCSYHAAMRQSERSTEYGSGEKTKLSAEGLAGNCSGTSRRRPPTQVPSKAWRRVVGRAAEAMLKHLVYGTVAEVESGVDADGLSGVYGISLRNVVDMLAEGCRDSGNGPDQSDEAAAGYRPHGCGSGEGGSAPQVSPVSVPQQRCQVLSIHFTLRTPDVRMAGTLNHGSLAQAAFLAALCQVATCMEWASAGSRRGGVEYGGGGTPPPLLSHQQRLCRVWLSTGLPRSAVNSAGLPPPALLRLLPLVAGPVRRAAAATAAAAAAGRTWCGPAAEDILAASGLSELSCAWVRKCLSQPAVLLEPRDTALAELELAAACFPVADAGSHGGSGRAAAATMALVRSAGGGLAVSERPFLKQLVRHQLVMHADLAAAGARGLTGSEASSPNRGSPLGEEARQGTEVAARTAVMRLSRAAVLYDWKSLGQPEWHALLQIVQEQMAEAVSALTNCLSQLAAAGRAAADAVLHQPPGTTAGSMALQLLRGLCQRGTLGRLAQGRQLEAAVKGAMATCALGPATLAAAKLASLLLDLQLAIILGAVECWGAAFGAGAAAGVAAWLVQHRGFWGAVAHCACWALEPGREQLGAQAGAAAVDAQATMLEVAGLDAVAALLAVASTPGPHLLQPVAYRLLLSEALLPQMTLATTAASSDGAADVELPRYDGDDVTFLVAGGVRHEMAPWLLPSAAQAARASGHGVVVRAGPYLTSWALLLAHALNLDAGSRGLAVLWQVLREVESLVYGLLDWLVPELGLKEYQAQGERHRPHTLAASRGGGGNASTATAASADRVERWRLAEALMEIGLPTGPHAVRATCRSLYRAVLRALPATARGWFGDLRERGLASMVESYTAVVEGPALLEAEIASVQDLKRREAHESRFTVRASAASREVVATLEVADGAVLELVVKLPACLPLRAPEVECRRKVGVNETRLRKWLLSIATFLRHHNSSVADAIVLWRRNVDSEFEGVEACLICYSVISSVNGQLPRLVCRTCSVRFHPACLYKWFKSAGKSQCPHCQALW
ncbi:hypothetical protein VaNZ11_005740 [Volvox africanus]|uniref:E3 ubiquitin-protein ligase listerin n=1 Tax=Volvox africanus TaxID=51714 RepID=A0ABQ5RZ56_9CHLO|nr:hypothetical protein VaNZ11_005740 [Volvox africanus]